MVRGKDRTVGASSGGTTSSSPPDRPGLHFNLQDGRTLSRNDVLSQVRELKEREKRTDSIILRGFGDKTLEEVNTVFESICQELGMPVIPLMGLAKLPSTIPIYRARIANEDQRRSLISKAPELRHSQRFSQLYINRDLTRQQREDIKLRRQQRRQDQEGDGAQQESTITRMSRNQGSNRGSSNSRGGVQVLGIG